MGGRSHRRRGVGGPALLPTTGEAAGQEVFHPPVHVPPRYADDAVRVEWPRGDRSTEGEEL